MSTFTYSSFFLVEYNLNANILYYLRLYSTVVLWFYSGYTLVVLYTQFNPPTTTPAPTVGGMVLLTSAARAGMSLNPNSWDWFCRLLEPGLASHEIEPLGTVFVDFWSQGQKLMKSSLGGEVLGEPHT